MKILSRHHAKVGFMQWTRKAFSIHFVLVRASIRHHSMGVVRLGPSTDRAEIAIRERVISRRSDRFCTHRRFPIRASGRDSRAERCTHHGRIKGSIAKGVASTRGIPCYFETRCRWLSGLSGLPRGSSLPASSNTIPLRRFSMVSGSPP